MNVTYWPSTESSIKRCTYVNKQKQVDVKQKYNQDTDGLSQFQFQLELESVGDKMPAWEQLRDWGLAVLSDLRLSNPAKMRKKCCFGQKNFGSICSSLSPSPTHLSHTSIINPVENEVWELYFYKEVYSFVHWSRHYCWLCFPIYLYHVYVCGYTTWSA